MRQVLDVHIDQVLVLNGIILQNKSKVSETDRTKMSKTIFGKLIQYVSHIGYVITSFKLMPTKMPYCQK